MKLWAGRFSGEADKRLNDFNSSIAFDSRMVKEDIQGSVAHAKMLGETGIIPQDDCIAIIEGLNGILHDLQTGKLPIDPMAEDVHTFVEGELTVRIGDAGKRLHTARSRNDQVALDIRLYLKGEIKEIQHRLVKLVHTLCELAGKYHDTVMPGYTHLQIAQPITFGHHLMAYAQMFCRDIKRLKNAKTNMDEMPLGSGALAGTTYPIDRKIVADTLGFAALTQNSLDAVGDRDFCIELASTLSIVMMHLSRFSEEVILWCSWEFKYIELSDSFSTGSSIMPQKKNPDVAELVRGKSGRVFGDLMTLLTVMKGLPLAYNKDMQEDKEAVFDAVDAVKMCLDTFTPMIETMKVNQENMRSHAAQGFINATDCADYLVKRGMPFRDAYKITGAIVKHCIENKFTLETLPLEGYQEFSKLFDSTVYAAVNIENCVNGRSCIGGPSPDSVKRQIAGMKAKLEGEGI